MNDNPEYISQVMEILKSKGALNEDGTIKDDLGTGISKGVQSRDILTTGYVYTLMGYGASNINYPKENVGSFTNISYSNTIPWNVTEKFTGTTTLEVSASLGSEAGLEKVYKINAGVSLSYTHTIEASKEYGTQITVKPRTTAKIMASPLKTCYSYRETYYLLGIEINYKLVGVFKPVAAHWYYSESGI